MFSKVLVTLIDVFLILDISVTVTSATPASAGKAQNTTQSLAPRALDVRQTPYDPHRCVDPYTWQRRECVGTRAGGTLVSRAWVDVCLQTRTTKYDNKQGICDDNNYCLNTYSSKSRTRAIICVPLQNSRGKQLTEAQTGSSDQKTSNSAVVPFQYSVQIDHDMSAASVSAVIKGECHNVNVHFLMFLC